MAAAHSGPRVSVVIPTYNNARYLGTAIDSILAQDFSALELIIVDDGSHDDTAERVARYRDPRIRYLKNETSRGIAGARNRGLDAARGEFMASLDSDDRAEPTRLSRQIAFLDAHPGHAAVGSWASWMNADGAPCSGITRRPVDWEDAAAQLIYKASLQQPSVTGRTAVLREYRYDERFRLSSDYELWTRLAEQYRLASLARPLVCCRRHETSTTRGQQACVIEHQYAIFARQLDRLGMAYDHDDLERHRLLWRSAKREQPASIEDMDWASDWLMRLADANRRRGCYPNDAFDAVLGWGWCQIGYSVLRRAPHRIVTRWLHAAPVRFIGRRAWRTLRRPRWSGVGLAGRHRPRSVRP